MPEFLSTDADQQWAMQRALNRIAGEEALRIREERRQQAELQQVQLQQAAVAQEATRQQAVAKLATLKAFYARRAELIEALVPSLDELWHIQVEQREVISSLAGIFADYADFSQARQAAGLSANHTDASPCVHNPAPGDYGRWLAGTIEIMLAGAPAAQLGPGYAAVGPQATTFTP